MSWVDELLARFPGALQDPHFLDELAVILTRPFADGMMAANEVIGGAIQFGAASEQATSWARQYAADLVTKVDATSKQMIRDLVTGALEEEQGLTVRDLADRILGEFSGFADYRAERIARTETAFAFNHGTVAGYRDSGVEHVEVMDGPGCLPDGHEDGAGPPDPDVYGLQEEVEANGQIWSLDEAAQYPVGHPNCVRAFAALIAPPPSEEA